MALPIALGMGQPDAILQQWDAVFHANGIQAIKETGNASTFGAMSPLFGATDADYYYPAVWHALVALAPGFGSVAAAANASTFVFGIVVWLTGIAGLAHLLFAGRPNRVILTGSTIAFAAAFSAFPFVTFSTLAQWPMSAGIALIPGTVALVMAGLGKLPGTTGLADPARTTVTTLILVTAIAGIGMTHGSAFFSLLLVLLPFLTVTSVGTATTRWQRGQHRRVITASVAVLAVLAGGLVVILTEPTIVNMLQFPRDTNKNYFVTAFHTIADYPLVILPIGTWPVTITVLLGLVTVIRTARRPSASPTGHGLTWVAAAWVLVIMMTTLAAGPNIPLRMLTGFWYAQAARIAAVYPVLAAPLAAVGLAALTAWLLGLRPIATRRVGAPAVTAVFLVAAVVVTGGWNLSAKVFRFQQAYVPGQIVWGTMASTDEIALLKRLGATTEPHAVILGDPANGAAFAWSVGGRHVVLPHLGASGTSADQQILRQRFNELGTDPQVCGAVRRLNVTHYYLDTATTQDGAKQDRDGPGLQEAPESGLEVVDRGGTATLFRITACR